MKDLSEPSIISLTALHEDFTLIFMVTKVNENPVLKSKAAVTTAILDYSKSMSLLTLPVLP